MEMQGKLSWQSANKHFVYCEVWHLESLILITCWCHDFIEFLYTCIWIILLCWSSHPADFKNRLPSCPLWITVHWVNKLPVGNIKSFWYIIITWNIWHWSSGDMQDFSDEEAPTSEGGANLLFDQFSRKLYENEENLTIGVHTRHCHYWFTYWWDKM